jgi:hypothetical protein
MRVSHSLALRLTRGENRTRVTTPLPNFTPSAAKRKMHETARQCRGAGWGGVVELFNADGKRVGWRSFRPAVGR